MRAWIENNIQASRRKNHSLHSLITVKNAIETFSASLLRSRYYYQIQTINSPVVDELRYNEIYVMSRQWTDFFSSLMWIYDHLCQYEYMSLRFSIMYRIRHMFLIYIFMTSLLITPTIDNDNNTQPLSINLVVLNSLACFMHITTY